MEAGKGLYGLPFLHQLKLLGIRVLVMTQADRLHLDWPRDRLDGLYAVENIQDSALLRNAVGYLFRQEAIDRIIGLGEYDIELAASLREFFRLPGMPMSLAAHFRDKLAMRLRASQSGIAVPAFTPVFNDRKIADFLDSQPGPWLLKPRSGASSKGIRRLDHRQAVWDCLTELGDERLNHLLERYTPGRVYHVDSIVHDGQVLFAAAHQYGTPILDLHQSGGVYTTHGLRRGSFDEIELQALNRQVIAAFGLQEGVTHIEYLRPQEDGRLYFLEASSRVGAGMIEEMVETASGLNLWAEWAKIEAGHHLQPYVLPNVSERYAGVAICMTSLEYPDLTPLAAPGVDVRVPKPYHAAMLVQSDDSDEVQRLLQTSSTLLDQEFLCRV